MDDIFGDIFGNMFHGSHGESRGFGSNGTYEHFTGNGGGFHSGFGGSGFHSGNGFGGFHQQDFPQKGSDVKASINVTFDEAAFGADKRISLSGPDGSSGAPQTLQIHIPAGIDTGKSIRLKGKGMPGTGGGEPGDLLLKVTVGTRPGYERKGSDVYTTISIPYTTAVFGGEATVPTLYGNVICKIREGMQSGSKIRLRGKGIVSMKNPSVRGDQYVTIQIQVPQNLNYSAKEKMLYDTHAFRGYIKEAVRKFDSENRSEEVEETLQAIEDQKEYEREAHLEIVQSEAGISIRDRKKILALFREVIRDIYRDIHEILYFNEVLDVNEINSLKDEMDEQLLFTIFNGRQELLNVYGLVDIDDSEGATSVLKISVVGGNDEDVATESIEYVNGEAEYNLEQTSYMPVVKDSLDDGNKEAVKEAVNEFVLRIMDDCETMGYSEERRAEEDWDADAADILENR